MSGWLLLPPPRAGLPLGTAKLDSLLSDFRGILDAMARRGRPQASTETQREHVRRLAAQGRSRRQIAEDVFGDAHYRGRVDRILRSASRELPEVGLRADDAELELDGEIAAGMDVASLRELVDRYKQALATSDDPPTLSDIERLLRIEQRLATMAQFQRLKALTRDSTGSD